jgi:hypothetical protein
MAIRTIKEGEPRVPFSRPIPSTKGKITLSPLFGEAEMTWL